MRSEPPGSRSCERGHRRCGPLGTSSWPLAEPSFAGPATGSTATTWSCAWRRPVRRPRRTSTATPAEHSISPPGAPNRCDPASGRRPTGPPINRRTSADDRSGAAGRWLAMPDTTTTRSSAAACFRSSPVPDTSSTCSGPSTNRTSWRPSADQSVFEGERCGGGAGADAEFGEDVGEVARHGFLGNDQLSCDFGIGSTGRDESEDLDLAAGEPTR